MRLPFFAVEQGLRLEKTVLDSVIDITYSIEPERSSVKAQDRYLLFDKKKKKQPQSTR